MVSWRTILFHRPQTNLNSAPIGRVHQKFRSSFFATLQNSPAFPNPSLVGSFKLLGNTELSLQKATPQQLLNNLRDLCASAGDTSECLKLLKLLGRDADTRHFHEVLRQCGKKGEFSYSLDILDLMLEPDIRSYNYVLHAAAKSGSFLSVLDVFDIMKQSNIEPDIYSYSSLIASYANGGKWKEAIQTFEMMKEQNIPNINIRTYSHVIFACSKVGEWRYPIQLLNSMEKDNGIVPNVYCFNSTINACFQSEQYDQIEPLLQHMKQCQVSPDLVTFKTMICWCHQRKQWDNVIDFYRLMKTYNIIPDLIVYNLTLNSLFSIKSSSSLLREDHHQSRISLAQEIFDAMMHDNVQADVNTFKYLMNSYGLAGQWTHCLELFHLMLNHRDPTSSIIPNDEVIISLIQAYGRSPEFPYSDSKHHGIVGLSYNDNDKEENLKGIHFIFNLMKEHNIKPNIKIINTFLISCNIHIQFDKALLVLDYMHTNKLNANFITYTNTIELLEKTNHHEQSVLMMTDARKNGIFYQNWYEKENVINFSQLSRWVAKSMIRSLLNDFISKNQHMYLQIKKQSKHDHQNEDRKEEEMYVQKDVMLIVGEKRMRSEVVSFLKEVEGPKVTMLIHDDDFLDQKQAKKTLILKKKDIEKFVYFNAVEEPPLLKLLPKWIYF